MDIWIISFSFILTFIIEFLIIWVLFRKEVLKIAGYAFLMNLFSWPLANLLFDVYANFIVIEIGVVLIESVLIMKLFEKSYLKSIGVSLLVNFVSAVVGLIFTSFGIVGL